MSNTVIKVENLWKQYRYGTISHATLKKDLQGWWSRIRGKPDPNSIILTDQTLNTSTEPSDSFWALHDISIDIKQGEILGIIGKNGAGKSTLLKIMSRVTAPTKGQIKIKGHVASLLEVGTGFNPELTGRENIFLNGAILGMDRGEIRSKFDEIVSFAEVEKFIDTPVKRYSSGMYVRLAFGVAAHLEPDILLVDEVLAVGDASFQKKCLGKMKSVSGEGRTVVFVSHNMTALKSLCDNAVLLTEGKIKEYGEASHIVNVYLQTGSNCTLERKWDNLEDAPGNEHVRLIYAGISTDNDHNINNIDVETPLALKFRFINFKQKSMLNFSLVLYNQENIFVLNTGSDSVEFSLGTIEGVCHIPANFLNDETYIVRLLIVKDSSTPLIDNYDLLSFEVKDIVRNIPWMGKWGGVVRPKFDWDVMFTAHE